MMDVLPLVFGFGRQELIANAGIAGGIAMALAVLAMIVVSVLPAFSESWADRLGTSNTTPTGPDPKEVIPGREEPISAPSALQSGGGATGDDAASGETAVPEPETAGTDDGDVQAADGDDTDGDSAGRAEEARTNAADERSDEE